MFFSVKEIESFKHMTLKNNVIFSVLGIFFLLQGFGAVAQNDLERKADVNFKEGNYVLALKQYVQLYKKDQMNMKYNYRIGKCFLRTNFDKGRATRFLNYVTQQSDAPAESFFLLGLARMHAHQFAFARLTFKEYQRKSKRDRDAEEKAERYIQMCNRAREMINNPVDVTFENLGKSINTAANETHPFISGDETFMAFCSDRQYYTSNIFLADYHKGNNHWKSAEKGNSSINTIANDLLAGMTPDGKKMLVHNANKELNRNLYYTVRGNGRFQGLRKFGLNVNDEEGWQAGADISNGRDTLFFASNRPGGYGGYDIYMSLRLPDGSWSSPQNLGEVINTPYDDNYPNIMDDGKTLYFSSKGHNTMGGYDLFKTAYSHKIYAWKSPENLGYPVNDTYDNKTISFAVNRRYAYLSARKEDTEGGMDIYKVYFNKVEPDYSVISGTIKVGDSINSMEVSKVDTNVAISVYKSPEKELYGRYSFDYETGKFVIALIPGEYTIEVKGKAYKTYKIKITINDVYKEQPNKEMNIFLKRTDNS